MLRTFEKDRESFETVAEYMAAYDLSPYLPKKPHPQAQCCLRAGDEVELELRSIFDYEGPVAQPDDAVKAAAMKLFKSARTYSAGKYARHPNAVYFIQRMPRVLADRDTGRVYKEKGFVYMVNSGETPSFSGFELAVHILEPIDGHWYYWYAETPY